jgi:phosphate transport system protein
MSVLLQNEIERIKKRILMLGAEVEERLHLAVRALDRRDAALARRVIDGDPEIDRMEVNLEEECLKLLALHQPVATDLRFIVAAIKITSDLERIADLAVNVAERAEWLAGHPRMEIPFDFPTMSEGVKAMLRKSLDSLVQMDADAALEVSKADDEVDAINREMYARVSARIRNEPKEIDCWLQLLSVGRYLERIADHATNIAEDVMYLVRGDIVRHKAGAQAGKA